MRHHDNDLDDIDDDLHAVTDKIQRIGSDVSEVRKNTNPVASYHVQQVLRELNQLLHDFRLVECVQDGQADFLAAGAQVPGDIFPCVIDVLLRRFHGAVEFMHVIG